MGLAVQVPDRTNSIMTWLTRPTLIETKTSLACYKGEWSYLRGAPTHNLFINLSQYLSELDIEQYAKKHPTLLKSTFKRMGNIFPLVVQGHTNRIHSSGGNG